MGREASGQIERGGDLAEARFLLESTQLIVRGRLRHTFERAGITDVRATKGRLTFKAEGEKVVLHLEQATAEKWAEAMVKPPASLAQKLGITSSAKVYLAGPCSSPEVLAAIKDRTTLHIDEATQIVALVQLPEHLESIIRLAQEHPRHHVWLVYGKGKKVALGDAQIRATMREHGLVDSKSCSVSDELTATRYRCQTNAVP